MFDPLPDASFRSVESGTQGLCTGKLTPEFVDIIAQDVETMAYHVEKEIQTWRTDTHLTTVANHARKLSALMNHCLHRLQALYMSVLDARSTLGDCQRCWLELYALRLYMHLFGTDSPRNTQSPKHTLAVSTLGAFVENERDLHTLYDLGCPVWFIRPLSDLFYPSSIYTAIITTIDLEPDTSSQVDRQSNHIRGGNRHSYILSGHLAPRDVRDAIHTNAWNRGSSSHTPASAPKVAPTRRGGSDAKYSPSPQPSFLPTPLPLWNDALTRPAVKFTGDSSDPKATYSVPHPSWFTILNEDKQRRYFVNWLTVRKAWLHRMSTPRAKPLTPRMWKDFLSHGTERGPLDPAQNRLPKSLDKLKAVRNAKEIRSAGRLSARQQSQKYFLEMIPNVLSFQESTSLRWLGAPLFSSDPTHDCFVRRQILAEIIDIGFHSDLLHLDKILLPSLPETQRQQRFSELWQSMGRDPRRGYQSPPTSAMPSLGNPIWHLKVPVLEALRQIMCEWPNPPALLLRSISAVSESDADIKHVNQLHAEIATFYISTFTRQLRREPFIPTVAVVDVEVQQ
ncbi:hypothetical protein SISSUDRAFT_1045113 [Sistotremastrum suecicum HHB10207 ss-3]|uniref:Uncharacterized protein n=1 Tax=Sistotremastrum suecicum HHB10207 ss-3 TaxID=1314776 RepID=A0A166EP49_9AGAM|nr:hypothetical protein SISSUDRAFT_1045113 [Sistotremastrum suecicum HHB10207 ss-3]